MRVEAWTANGQRDRELWEAEALLTVNPTGVVLSTNRIALRNGVGSALVTFSGGTDFTLTASMNGVSTSRPLQSAAGSSITTVSGTLPGTSSTWSGIIQVTGDVTVPTGHTLTISSNTLVLIDGVASGTTAPDIFVNGSVQSLGTELHPVTITCSNANFRWGQIRHINALPSLYRHTVITRGGHATGEGHTGQAPVIRPFNSTINFQSCSITDHAQVVRTAPGFGTPGKIMFALNSALTFNDCLLSRARMGPEIQGTSLLFTNSYILEMYGPDDADGIYLHDQLPGQQLRLIDSVIAYGDDDGVDTLSSVVEVENCIIRNWINPSEDAKGISVFNGATHVRHCLIVDCLVGVSAKWSGGPTTLVTINNSTVIGTSNSVAANLKANAPGPFIDFRITNSIIWGVDPLKTDFGPTNLNVFYSDVAEVWTGPGNILADPLFVDAAAKNFRLHPISPARDSGDPATPLEADGTRVDMGFFTVAVDTDLTTNLMVSLGSAWKYLDNGSNQGTNWISLNFNDSAWSNGLSEFGYGDGDEQTFIGYGPNSTDKFVTTYFRRFFTLNEDPALAQNVTLQLLRDDGAVVYLNGREVWRVSLPQTPIGYQTYATSQSDYSMVQTNIAPTFLVRGTNVIAVEVHQGTRDSSDLSFDLAFSGIFAAPSNRAPSVALTGPASGTIFGTPATVALTATASDHETSVTNVEFYANTTRLGQDSASPYSFVWNNAPAGAYTLTAVARDATGVAGTSSPVTVTVSTNIAPPVLLSKIPAPGNLTNLTEISVIFSKEVQGINASDLLVNGMPATSVSGSNNFYTFTISQPAYGTVFITWNSNHGITDLFVPPNAFNHTAAGATWQYQLLDTQRPVLSNIDPVPGAALPLLSAIELTFSEAVIGLNASDLRLNSIPATSVSGTGVGPYTFSFPQPPQGAVQISWAPTHGIQDSSGNPFLAAPWSYVFNTNAAGIVISEIMYHASSENVLEEYIELFNRGSAAVNLSGWKLKGAISFAFSNVTLLPSDYLVVAADLAAFTNKYPDVLNVVGNWTGILNNSSEEIDLEDAAGQPVNSVRFADEGDWAQRQRGPLDMNHRGWVWFKEHDGLGKSLELINPDLPNTSGQNWGASVLTNGSPGRVNSRFQQNIPPMILNALHFPIIPRSSDPLIITAKIVDETVGNVTVTLNWRLDAPTPPAFSGVAMNDTGLNGDAVGGDGIYSTTLPPQTNNAVIEYYLRATQIDGSSRTWPAPAIAAEDGTGPTGQVVNALFQIDDAPDTSTQPLYKLIMTENERAELAVIPAQSTVQGPNAQMNGTFISLDGSGVDLHYLVGIRNRGHGSRDANPPNYHVNFRSDDPWKGVTGINLNTRQVHVQHFGSVLARKSGAAGPNTIPVEVRVNNLDRADSAEPMFGSYAAVEEIESDWAAAHFPFDSNGNLYRAVRDIPPPNFSYRGEDKTSYTNTWLKLNNVTEDDWTDLIGMLRVVGVSNAVPFSTESVRAVVNVEQWLRHLAVMNLMGNSESGLNSGYNDDYSMYRGVLDPRFILLYWDLDQILGENNAFNSTASIFSATQNNGAGQALNRFIHWPEFELIYYQILQELIDTTFSASQFDALADQTLRGYVPQDTIDDLKDWMAARRSYVQSVLPSITNTSPAIAIVHGVPRSPTPITSATLTVSGEGVSHYRFSLNGAPYLAEQPIATPIVLSGLSNGTNTLSVIGRTLGGVWQSMSNATELSWVVNTSWPAVRINEVLARNEAAVNHNGTFPDIIELYNEGPALVDLSGFRLSDSAGNPGKYTFPTNTTLAAGAYLAVYADNSNGTPGIHLGFGLDQNGDAVYLSDRLNNGGVLLDSVNFGFQAPDFSIGRIAGGDWVLTRPTRGSANLVQSLGDSGTIKINEWLAFSGSQAEFIELFNPDPLPVSLEGLFLTDQLIGAPTRSPISQLSFIAGNGFVAFIADGDGDPADHVNFQLAIEQGEIGLLDRNGDAIDSIIYGTQQPEVAEGRCEDGFLTITSLLTPTPGTQNSCPIPPPPPQTITLVAMTNLWSYEQSGTDLLTVWKETNYSNEINWPAGRALLAALIPTPPQILPEPVRTTLSTNTSKITFYFRTHFSVPSNTTFAGLQFRHIVDDGAVFYLNGTEVSRFNMPTGSVSFSTRALQSISDAALQGPVTISPTLLRTVDNVFAVEVHQSSSTSADMAFGLALDGLIITNRPSLAGVIINEILANNATREELDGSKPDWLELYNPSTNAVDLTGMSLTDATTAPRRWSFFPGTILPAQSFFKIRMDGSMIASATNTGFGLKANGGAVYLFNAPSDGGTLANSITYGLQAADWSLGRWPDGSTNWILTLPTFGSENIPASLGDPAQLKINEWMASPLSGSDWFEVFNPNPQPVDISRVWLGDDLTSRMVSQLPAYSFLGVGPYGFQRFDADRDLVVGADHVDFRLSATEEAIAISYPNGSLINGVSFGLQAAGVSQGRLPDGTGVIVPFPGTASPGNPNFLSLGEIVINELLSHTDPPLEDAVELYNPSGDDVDISGWYLSDSQINLFKYRIPTNTIVRAGGYLVLFEYQFNGDNPGQPFSFSSARGDEVYLSQSILPGVLTGYRAHAAFSPAENGVSFGRFQTSVGEDFTAMSVRTFGIDEPSTTNQFQLSTGQANAYPKIGPVVINEIMYHPLVTNDALEFVELRNITTAPVALFDPAYPENTWRLRKGVDFNFPPSSIIPAGGMIVVVSFDPANDAAARTVFQNAYGTNMVLFGPYSGKLDNAGEVVELQKPDPPQLIPGPDFGLVPHIVVDHIFYQDVAPWPLSADGFGDSLKRVNSTLYGNDPVNWLAGPPSPGAVNFISGTNRAPVLNPISDDSVHEGYRYSFRATAIDPDLPGQTLTFFLLAGAPSGATINASSGIFVWTPSAAQSPGNYAITVRVTDNASPSLSHTQTFNLAVLDLPRLSSVEVSRSGVVTLKWPSFPGRRYRVEYTDNLIFGPWYPLQEDVIAETTETSVTDLRGTDPRRFYRVLSIDH